jgi:hypothetical protein
MLPPFDIFRIDSDGRLLWQESAETFGQARQRVNTLKVGKRFDYVIYSQRTGHKSIVRQHDSEGEYPVCPTHDTPMVPHSFQPWELSLVQGTLDGFRCPNLSCPTVYIEKLGGFHLLDDGKLTPVKSDL